MKNRIHRAIDKFHLFYLGLLPAIATYSALVTFGTSMPGFVFIGGIVAVSVYLAATISYTRNSSSVFIGLFMLLDGPLWILVLFFRKGGVASFAIDCFLLDGIAIWVALGWLALKSSKPTGAQRKATVGFTVLAVTSIIFAFWPYIQADILDDLEKIIWMVVGISEAVIVRHYLMEADEVIRDESISVPYILIFLFIWIAAMCVGTAFSEISQESI